MSDTEQRFGLTMGGVDRDEPGLIRESDGTVWLVNPDGTRTQLPGSGGSQPAGSNKQVQLNDNDAFGASPDFVWDAGTLKLVTAENGTATIEGNGLGVQLQLAGAAGDATHVGGEIGITSGNSAGQNGGDIAIAAGGDDSADGNGGNISIVSGPSAQNDGGDISIRANAAGPAGFRGGDINVVAGGGTAHGGNVTVQGGGPAGNVQVYSGDGNQGVQVDNTGLNVLGKVGFYGAAPVDQPAAPVTLGDVIAALQALGLVAT